MGRYFNNNSKTLLYMDHFYRRDICRATYTDGTVQNISLDELGNRLSRLASFAPVLIAEQECIRYSGEGGAGAASDPVTFDIQLGPSWRDKSANYHQKLYGFGIMCDETTVTGEWQINRLGRSAFGYNWEVDTSERPFQKVTTERPSSGFIMCELVCSFANSWESIALDYNVALSANYNAWTVQAMLSKSNGDPVAVLPVSWQANRPYGSINVDANLAAVWGWGNWDHCQFIIDHGNNTTLSYYAP